MNESAKMRVSHFMLLGGVLSLAACAWAGQVQSPKKIPVLGYQLDVSRAKVPTMATLRRMVDVLSRLGYNQFQLYTEHTFAYAKHEVAWYDASPMTPAEVRELDAYCAARGIELVPNQNSFGHLEQWLRHPEYNHLAEAPRGGTTSKPHGYTLKFPMCLNPTDPRSVEFVAGLYDELFPCFRSKLVNVGCDETMELLDDHEPPLGRSAETLKRLGPHRVYVDFLNKLHKLCADRGHTMMFWGDIILHHPELLADLPKDVICLNWGYEADHPFEKETAALEKSGRRFYVCPSTTTWCTLVGRTTTMLANVDNCLAAGERHGAAGVLMTDWGNTGHPAPWVCSLPSLVYLAHRRAGETMTREKLAAEVDRICGCRCGRALLELGDVYLVCDGKFAMEPLLRNGVADVIKRKGMTEEKLRKALAAWKAARAACDLTGAPDWVRTDFETIDLYEEILGVRLDEPDTANFRGRFEPRYRELWLRQNRRGGLNRSLALVFGNEYP